MKTSAATERTSTPTRADLSSAADEVWRERSGRLFEVFEPAAKAMVRRAFRGAFGPDELDDIYANAWVGTLRALAHRHRGLADDEIRSYVLTAVANQASKELRRRKRKPTAPLESAPPVADSAGSPEERAAAAEQSAITRDLLSSLPKRRRAVILLRYGWGLEPRQVCELVKGLSPRAYRKEITRGIDELTENMRRLERGEWCAEREGLLKDFVAGVAGEDGARQAKAHISHCRECSDFVARLTGHLHDLGAALVTPVAVEQLARDGRLADLLEHGRTSLAELVGRTGGSGAEGAAALATSGGARGAGAVGAGALAKLAGLGAAGKLAVACVGGGVAATACVAAGIGPLAGPPGESGARADAPKASKAATRGVSATPAPAPATLPSQVGHQTPSEPAPGSGPVAEPQPRDPEPEQAPAPAPPPDPVADSAPPVVEEFGTAAAAAPAQGGASGGGGGSSSGDASAARQEFSP